MKREAGKVRSFGSRKWQALCFLDSVAFAAQQALALEAANPRWRINHNEFTARAYFN
jgi:hypothetical protein